MVRFNSMRLAVSEYLMSHIDELDTEQEIKLRPIENPDESIASGIAMRLRKAQAILELEKIQADAALGNELCVREMGAQVGIGFLLTLTTLVAITFWLVQRFGSYSWMIWFPLAAVFVGWLYVFDWQNRHHTRIAKRLSQFRRRYRDVPIDVFVPIDQDSGPSSPFHD
ncbi:MAG: hypothetical protein KDB03_04845 [Planctomycetales bacterium]|nr:hypothetical protein [Planctomycetales bacterium]